MLYNPKIDLNICGGYISYLEETRSVKLNALLKIYNLTNTVTFQTRIKER
jgi:hypothetical protein